MLYSIPSLNLPKIVPNSPDEFYKIPCQGKIYDKDMGEYGEYKVIGEFKGLCNYQEKAKRVFTTEGAISKVVGTCEFNYDILPKIDTIYSGELEIFGSVRHIASCTKGRDNYGNVIFTQLELE